MQRTSGRNAGNARKNLCEVFQQVGLKITTQVCHHVVKFLIITLDLKEKKSMPFRKPNDIPLYVNSRSNHPPSILRKIPRTIKSRISSLLSCQQSFNECLPAFKMHGSQATLNSLCITPIRRLLRHHHVDVNDIGI